MKQRELIKRLLEAGYRFERKGNHLIYAKPGGRAVQVPDHREINEMLARQILKDAGIKFR